MDLFSDNDEGCRGYQPDYTRAVSNAYGVSGRKKQACCPAGTDSVLPQVLDLERYADCLGVTLTLRNRYLTVRRSSPLQRSKAQDRDWSDKAKEVRIVDFCDTLADILKKRKGTESRYSVTEELYQRNYYRGVKEKESVSTIGFIILDGTEDIPLDYNEIDLVCIRPDGAYEAHNG